MQRAPVIVLTGGGSGGHIMPLLSLARELKAKSPHCTIVYIGHKGDKFDSLQERFHDFDFVAFVNGGKFRRYHGESWLRRLTDIRTMLLNMRDFFRVFGSIGKAWRILAKVNPDVVFSKGGFVAVPVGIAAYLRRIPIVTHDSDTVPGLANRIIGRWAKLHATGMPAEFYNYPEELTVYTGIPIDERIKPVNVLTQKEYKQELGIDPRGLILLVVGGALGSRNLNQKIQKIAPELLETNPKLYLIHITGQNDEQESIEEYSKLSPQLQNRVTVLGFSADFHKYIQATDLVVSRAGATALAEFAAAHKACLLMPSPFLTGGHQVKNAEELKKIGAVETIGEDVSAEELLGKIVSLLGNSKKRHNLASRLGSTAKLNAAAELANILIDVAFEASKA